MRPLLTVGLCLFLALACSRTVPPTAPARKVADWFVDKQYVEMKLALSVQVTHGVAADKIRKELALTGSVRRKGYTAQLAQQRVYWEHRGAEGPDEEGTERHAYRLTIDAGALRIQKDVRLALARREGSWRVVSIQETDVEAKSEGE